MLRRKEKNYLLGYMVCLAENFVWNLMNVESNETAEFDE